MKKDIIKILGIPFINAEFQQVVAELSERIRKQTKSFIVTANPEIVMYARDHLHYQEIIKSADLIVPDGIGIIIASKIQKQPLQERIAGYDLMMQLLELANQNRWRIYLLGGRPEANEKAVRNIVGQYPNLIMAGARHGYFTAEEEAEIVVDIARANADLVFVALGFPKQEKWIVDHYSRFSKGIFIGVGGSIDVIAGEAKRAPEFWQKMNLEWLYRLIKQPSRWRRMLALPKFLIEVMKERK